MLSHTYTPQKRDKKKDGTMLGAVLIFYASNAIKIDKYCVYWPPRREFRLWRISFGLPLTSELDALCTEDANPSRLRRQVRSVQVTKAPAAGILPAANMPTLAAGEQAPRRSRLACEPTATSSLSSFCGNAKKRPPQGWDAFLALPARISPAANIFRLAAYKRA